ncbi:MAG: uridine kinase [Nocardioidaceae bacterium]
MLPAPPTDQRRAVLARVAAEIPRAARPLLVAIDGVDGSGKSCFADELAAVLEGRGDVVVRASVDGFHHPREHRHALGRTPEAVWTRHFDYRTLRRELLDPWLRGGGAPYRPVWHDVETDQRVDVAPMPVPEQGVLVVDGVFAQRPELEQAWDLVVWLEVPFEVSVRRMAARDGSVDDVADPDQRRYADAQRIYLASCGPQQRADVVVDNADLERPLLVRPVAEPPPGWTLEGDELVRTVRLPAVRRGVAEQVNRLLRDGDA